MSDDMSSHLQRYRLNLQDTGVKRMDWLMDIGAKILQALALIKVRDGFSLGSGHQKSLIININYYFDFTLQLLAAKD